MLSHTLGLTTDTEMGAGSSSGEGRGSDVLKGHLLIGCSLWRRQGGIELWDYCQRHQGGGVGVIHSFICTVAMFSQVNALSPFPLLETFLI